MATGRFMRAKTIVFWDIDACRIPDGLYATHLGQSLRQTLVSMKYYGRVSFRTYGHNDPDKVDYGTFQCCGLPYTSIPEQILVDLYGDSVSDRCRPLNMLLVVGDLSKDEAIINAFNVLPLRGWINVLVCQPSAEAVDSALLSSQVQLPPWEDIVQTAFEICEEEKEEKEENRKRNEEIEAEYLEWKRQNSQHKIKQAFFHYCFVFLKTLVSLL